MIICHFIIWAASWQNQQKDCALSKDSDQPGHAPSLIRVFTVRMKKAWVLSYPLSAQRRLWSDWADAQADLSLHWVHTHFVGFVIRRLICHFVICSCRLLCVSASWGYNTISRWKRYDALISETSKFVHMFFVCITYHAGRLPIPKR